MDQNAGKKKTLLLNLETVRRLRKRDLEEVMGGTIVIYSSSPSCNNPRPQPAQQIFEEESRR